MGVGDFRHFVSFCFKLWENYTRKPADRQPILDRRNWELFRYIAKWGGTCIMVPIRKRLGCTRILRTVWSENKRFNTGAALELFSYTERRIETKRSHARPLIVILFSSCVVLNTLEVIRHLNHKLRLWYYTMRATGLAIMRIILIYIATRSYPQTYPQHILDRSAVILWF